MNNLTTKITHISYWLECIQIPRGEFKFQRVLDYESRIRETRRKTIALERKIQTAIGYGYKYNEVWAHQLVGRLYTIYSSIGVYTISSIMDGTGWVWRKGDVDSGTAWYDWFGDQSIRESGGKVVVMLSDKCVSHLNEINREVDSIPSSYTTE